MQTLSQHLALMLALAAITTSAARAELIYGVTDEAIPTLVRFDSASPEVSTIIGPTGIATLRAIDFRPVNGMLYGLDFNTTSFAAQLYTIDLTTGAATPIFAPVTLTGASSSTRVSIDFNPVSGLIRVVTGNGSSFRINPDTGALTPDTTFAYAAGDPSEASNPPEIVGVAYTNNFPGATSTTLYAYDFNLDNGDTITRVGDIGGSPLSPNTGQMFTVGGLGGPLAFRGDVGFDISGLTGLAYLNLDEFNSLTFEDEFYTVNLSTGAATFLGTTTGVNLLDISVAPVPEPSTIGLVVIGMLGLVAAARRRQAVS